MSGGKAIDSDDRASSPSTRDPSRDRIWALVDAGISLSSELDLDQVLERIVQAAATVIGARYAALGVLNEDGDGLSNFVYHGIDHEQAERIGPLPVGRGLLGAVIAHPEPIRLDEMSADARSVGFPEHHPEMNSFLGVPVRVRESVFGNLYLTEKLGDGVFSEEDERLALALASQAGVAIENARLYSYERDRVRFEAELAESRVREEMRADMLREVIRAQEEERRRVARELHDTGGQALASILLGLKVVAGERTLAEARSRLADLREVTAQAAADVRRLALELRPSVLDDLGLQAALERYTADLADRLEIPITLDAHIEHRPNEETETVLYRVAQESLTNAIKYAEARSISVYLDGSTERILLRVTDDGVGFDPATVERKQGLGLRGMEERAALVSGEVSVTSAPGHGTVVELTVPFSGRPG